MSPEQVGNLIHMLRLEAELTQADLAKRLPRPQSYVSKLENGSRSLRVDEPPMLCGALGLSPV